ncbi:MAG TPA: hypothetical protein VK203_17020 [Nostocaceae cyanobacterium]|nr:hypothetical protein [Nostocaceae cyanobacterium]
MRTQIINISWLVSPQKTANGKMTVTNDTVLQVESSTIGTQQL